MSKKEVRKVEARSDKLSVYGVVVAELFIRPDGHVFLVKRKGKNEWTFPTGGVETEEWRDISPASFREAKEEVFQEIPREAAKEILTISVRPGIEPEKSHLIAIFVFEVDGETASLMRYEEAGENLFVWIEPRLAMSLPLAEPIEEIPNMPLDELAKDGLLRYLEKHPSNGKKEEGFNGTKTIEKRQKIQMFLQKLNLIKLIFKKSLP